ncbi:uncharacterized protein G2W53_011328 [Senna tora]|uniref:Uncharacterized protein n=1 Tax=Senna tora TaxID=362788 RepID=A0A834X1S1_9FABA|nr:uncharacterized protein G2W53_011328 [Senna tora]
MEEKAYRFERLAEGESESARRRTRAQVWADMLHNDKSREREQPKYSPTRHRLSI